MSCLDITGLCIDYFINSPIFAHRGISHFYAHIGAGPKVFRPPMSKLMLAKDLLTLASILYYSRI